MLLWTAYPSRTRDVAGVVPDDAGRRDARRHDPAGGQRDRDDLRDGAADVASRLEVDLEDTDAVHRLRVNARDAAHRGRHGALADEDDAPFHVVGGQARVVPHHDDDRDVDGRQDVRLHPAGGEQAEDRDERAEHRDGVRTTESESDDPHTASAPGWTAAALRCSSATPVASRIAGTIP